MRRFVLALSVAVAAHLVTVPSRPHAQAVSVSPEARASKVEKGKLALDEDVNARLTSWKVPDNEFTRTEKVTLRRLLSHSAGLTVHGFGGYQADAPVPALGQVLDGQQKAPRISPS